MYQPFSDPKYIEKMVRRIVVFLEEATLQMHFCEFGDDFYEVGHGKYRAWIKYLSTNSGIEREINLLWDDRIEEDFLNDLRLKIEKDKDYLPRMDLRFKKAYLEFEKITDFIFKIPAADLSQMGSGELAVLFGKFRFYGNRALLAYYIPYNMIEALVKLIKDKISRKNPDSNIDDMLKILSYDGVDTIIHSERKAFLEILIYLQGNFDKNENTWQYKEVIDKIFQLWYEIGALGYVHGSEQNYSFEDYLNKFKNNIDIDAKAALLKLDSEFERVYNRYLSTINKYADEKLKPQVEWLRKMIQYRNKEAEYFDLYFNHCMNFFEEIAKILKIGVEDLWFLSAEEIKSGLMAKFDKKLVEERKKYGFTIKQMGNEVLVYTGVKEGDKIKEEFKTDDLIKGQVTFSGLVRGRVKIISNPFHQGKYFQAGDILVTAMTTPDFVPLMKKASAIVTDEGGILSHASIVSRELKKPCIIGTKHATKILKDGDEIEVDAKEGIVRILTKHLTQHLVNHFTI